EIRIVAEADLKELISINANHRSAAVAVSQHVGVFGVQQIAGAEQRAAFQRLDDGRGCFGQSGRIASNESGHRHLPYRYGFKANRTTHQLKIATPGSDQERALDNPAE